MISHLNRHILRTWVVPFAGMLIFVSALFFIQKFTIWLPKFIQHDAPLDLVFTLFAAMIPFELTLLIPVAFFFAVIKFVREIQSNSELDAMYAGGLSIFNIFTPIFWVGILLTLSLFWLNMELAPMGKIAAYNAASELSSIKAEPSFQPRRFVIGIDKIVFYFEGKNPDGTYSHIMLSDSRIVSRAPDLYFAESATISRIDSGLMVRLFDGSQLSGDKRKMRATHFSDYNIEVPLKLESKFYKLTSSQSTPYMSGAELYATLKQEKVPPENVAQWHYRLVSSFSVLLLFLFAVPISLQAKRSKQSAVYLIAILIMVTINQAELILFKKISLDVAPWWSLWLALALFTAIGARMFYIVNKRGSINLPLYPKFLHGWLLRFKKAKSA